MTAREILLAGGDGAAWNELARRFAEAGAEVARVGRVTEAKTFLREKRVGMLLLAMDGLPEAVDLVREFVFLFRGLPLVALSERGTVHQAREAIAAGAADYHLLPLTAALAREILERYSGAYFDPELGRGRQYITGDQTMKRLLAQVRRVAASRATVLIQGESGTGKELVARYIHQVSDRAEGPFVAVNCAALPENLLESELFGHAKGAFTGAIGERKGKFQQAHGGTLLLDEISEMDVNLQAKLLRVLQEGEVDPVGGRSPVTVDVRILASTNRDLKEWAAAGRFREDLFYRLNVFPLRLPPLRERPGDILLLAEHFRKRFVSELNRNDIRFSRAALGILSRHAWMGNIRELENVVYRALLVAEGSEIGPEDLMIEFLAEEEEEEDALVDLPPMRGGNRDVDLPVGTTVREMEELLIRRTLSDVNGNRTQAAKLLGISIRTLRNKLNEYAGKPVG